MMLRNAIILAFSTLIGFSSAFNNQCNDNIVDYWGQNSYGASHPENPPGWQQPLRHYCDDDTIDTFPVASLTTFFSVGGKPEINKRIYQAVISSLN